MVIGFDSMALDNMNWALCRKLARINRHPFCFGLQHIDSLFILGTPQGLSEQLFLDLFLKFLLPYQQFNTHIFWPERTYHIYSPGTEGYQSAFYLFFSISFFKIKWAILLASCSLIAFAAIFIGRNATFEIAWMGLSSGYFSFWDTLIVLDQICSIFFCFYTKNLGIHYILCWQLNFNLA